MPKPGRCAGAFPPALLNWTKMLAGEFLEGDSFLSSVAGPSGTGKSALATQFIAEGLRQGEPGIMAIFEERPEGYAQRADSFGLDLKSAEQKGTLELLYMRPLDLSVDETMQAILDAINRVGAKRLVIDLLVPGFWRWRAMPALHPYSCDCSTG